MSGDASWTGRNQRYLAAALGRIRRRLERHADPDGGTDDPEPAAVETWETYPPPALHHLSVVLGLSEFERDVVLLCAGVELDTAFAMACSRAHGGGAPSPDFALAMAVLEGAHWSAIAPGAPLRYWRLIELGAGETITRRALRLDERILHFLAGVGSLDERLQGLVEPLGSRGELPASHAPAVDRIASLWSAPDDAPPLVCLCGDDRWGKREVAVRACEAVGFGLYVTSASDLPTAVADREAMVRLWGREAVLELSALLVELDDADPPEVVRAAAAFADHTRSPLLVASREPLRVSTRVAVTVDVDRPVAEEQRALWLEALGPAAPSLNGHLDRLVTQFRLGAREIRLAGAQARREGSTAPEEIAEAAWNACRAQSRPRLDDLAQRIDTRATWEDLVLPDPQVRTLREIVGQVRQRALVYGRWGFARGGTRGLGISALFSGASGTGKTLAAEVLANELGLDLYRIDLSQVVSKYIGETEKNLRRVFDVAEESGAVLLFDEADALFGKRSEVKDSHDRYANIEVSYLLQRMEAYRGLAILTTNLKKALDTAFLRRLRFIVTFPFPDAQQRAEIWRRTLPPELPTRGIEVESLAQLNVAGGNIRNIALAAAFLAADDDEPVQMKHLLQAARGEYGKLERPLSASEIAGWT